MGRSAQARIQPVSTGCFRLIRYLTGEQLANRCRTGPVSWCPGGHHFLQVRTCVRVTSKGSITGQLQRALEARDVLAVRSLAGELPSVPLPIAAQITLLLLEKEPEAYATAARRLLGRLASERAMPLIPELAKELR